jgi:hypothetical protein
MSSSSTRCAKSKKSSLTPPSPPRRAQDPPMAQVQWVLCIRGRADTGYHRHGLLERTSRNRCQQKAEPASCGQHRGDPVVIAGHRHRSPSSRGPSARKRAESCCGAPIAADLRGFTPERRFLPSSGRAAPRNRPGWFGVGVVSGPASKVDQKPRRRSTRPNLVLFVARPQCGRALSAPWHDVQTIAGL